MRGWVLSWDIRLTARRQTVPTGDPEFAIAVQSCRNTEVPGALSCPSIAE